ncbi:MAG: hypothetical protein EXS47_02080 [Candidatus Zambryskibacteria bacterium]|nr:hypothetical protein [Candidatus Zambryskibacteria bacterium]
MNIEFHDEVTREERQFIISGEVGKKSNPRQKVRWGMIYGIIVVLGLIQFWIIDWAVDSFWK